MGKNRSENFYCRASLAMLECLDNVQDLFEKLNGVKISQADAIEIALKKLEGELLDKQNFEKSVKEVE